MGEVETPWRGFLDGAEWLAGAELGDIHLQRRLTLPLLCPQCQKGPLLALVTDGPPSGPWTIDYEAGYGCPRCLRGWSTAQPIVEEWEQELFVAINADLPFVEGEGRALWSAWLRVVGYALRMPAEASIAERWTAALRHVHHRAATMRPGSKLAALRYLRQLMSARGAPAVPRSEHAAIVARVECLPGPSAPRRLVEALASGDPLHSRTGLSICRAVAEGVYAEEIAAAERGDLAPLAHLCWPGGIGELCAQIGVDPRLFAQVAAALYAGSCSVLVSDGAVHTGLWTWTNDRRRGLVITPAALWWPSQHVQGLLVPVPRAVDLSQVGSRWKLGVERGLWLAMLRLCDGARLDYAQLALDCGLPRGAIATLKDAVKVATEDPATARFLAEHRALRQRRRAHGKASARKRS